MPKLNDLETYYGLPKDVIFCKKCVTSNQRPLSVIEFKHTMDSKKKVVHINENGLCDTCKFYEQRKKVDWLEREKELKILLDEHRSKDGSYDCVVPGSGGKDSGFAAYILKYKYGMHPLTVTWPPILYTDYGYHNWKNWVNSGFDNIKLTPNGRVMKLLTKLSIENLFHPFQTFILGQKNAGAKIAALYNIPLVFYGETEGERGHPIKLEYSALRDNSYHTYKNLDDVYLGGISVRELREKYKVELSDIKMFLPPTEEELEKTKVEVRTLGYYIRWDHRETYQYSVKHTGFKPRPFRTQGTYTRHSSIDDKIDDLHYYTTFIKFGIGRATYNASEDIRDGYINREDAKALVKQFDGEFPDRYFNEVMEYLGIDPDYFKYELTDRFRSPHLWKKVNGKWYLRHTVNKDGVDD